MKINLILILVMVSFISCSDENSINELERIKKQIEIINNSNFNKKFDDYSVGCFNRGGTDYFLISTPLYKNICVQGYNSKNAKRLILKNCFGDIDNFEEKSQKEFLRNEIFNLLNSLKFINCLSFNSNINYSFFLTKIKSYSYQELIVKDSTYQNKIIETQINSGVISPYNKTKIALLFVKNPKILNELRNKYNLNKYNDSIYYTRIPEYKFKCW